ncbi:MAG TPA: phospholipid carrier-dependent glycosyltransferase [Campylobacterales bacterium]|nr:phospholipid carrier-dependent glycosyltransferase [Campylobacterales bacterium]
MKFQDINNLSQIQKAWMSTILIALIGFFTYFYNYMNPPKQFWDENYHIASAQKYIDGVFFFEPHPPLGKILIALGEVIVSPNKSINTKPFLETDYIKKFPKKYSFAGMRLIPSLMGWLNAILLFWLLYFLTDKIFLAFLGTSLYLFDNAMILHFRAAMLESIQIFFMLLALIWFVREWKKEQVTIKTYSILGILITLGVMIKANSAILLLLPAFLWYRELCTDKVSFKEFIVKNLSFLLTSTVIVYAVFALHFTLVDKPIKNRTYNAPASIIADTKDHNMLNPINTFKGIAAYYKYMKRYESRVPKYNPCKKGENGSLAITWPLINKTINYRWERKDGIVRYLYLMGNPIVWFLSLLGVLGSFVLVISKAVYKTPITHQEYFRWILIFTTLYVSYMLAVMQIERVMYLYHYFIPLIFAIILFTLQVGYIYNDLLESKDRLIYGSLIGLIFIIIVVYAFFAPLTYYLPLDLESFNKRIWFDFWHLQPVR